MKRNATAVWNGTIKEGNGHLTTQSTILDKTQYSYNSRFEHGKGTNPEELVAAAHAGCFTMQLSANLSEENLVPKTLESECTITLEDGTVTQSFIKLKAEVDGVTEEKFEELVRHAEKNCPMSKLLDTEIKVDYTLN
ncbi:osmotically inducible protein OsmC [Pustulibacterium marinum]|uniref:Osmotically inducible protein OsmC n=1 Tax=Pustulibacterium marinum TaxID=1224947 RepID=A0A1I7I831_9FLAO|nr:OsmC family peroxiredoxin [Pustulibacterium marinum]SFU69068.1 osmotically inducible protein OsmC [Pustulibacterium marinum]